jgi:beta-alanine--pyruvate transaminase
MTLHARLTANDLDSYWMPFTANRHFKTAPRILSSAKGMYFKTDDGRDILDGTAGLWCVHAGHTHPKIVNAIQQQAAQLDYGPAFQMGHPKAFELSSRAVQLAPGNLNHIFFTNSGSEAVDTALKIALAYHRLKCEAARVRLIGRERGFHGVNFGGTSVGGMMPNRKMFGNMLPAVDHLRHTHDLARNAFTRGEPEHGVELAEDLERLVALHDASTIAALIVEPVACSTGVLIPPRGYLRRLREICDKHGILLIFDEVITGFGRLGTPFAADYYDIVPDMITSAKGITNGAVPMGAVFVKSEIYQAFLTGPAHAVEFFHGYTYSGHPLACAAGVATLEIYAEEDLFRRVSNIAPLWENAMHSLAGLPHVIDIRNIGLIGAVELEPVPGLPGKRAFEVYLDCFAQGLLIRTTGDVIALSPPFIVSEDQIGQIVDILGSALKRAA